MKLLQLIGVLAAAIGLAACVDDSVGDPAFDESALFVDTADQVIIPNYQRQHEAAEQLVAPGGPLATYCAAIDSVDEVAARVQAQAAWRELASAIQYAELHQLGPALDNDGALQKRMNSFAHSTLSTCGIDQSVVQAAQNARFDVGVKTVSQRGIGALEYLLFNDALTHSCPSQVVETADWDQRSQGERKQLRCSYAHLLADDMADAAATLLDSWLQSGDNYRQIFVNPINNQDSFDALVDALFAIEVGTKDQKLGLPLGLNAECGATACPLAVEAPHSEASLTNIRDNLLAFQRVVRGGDGVGLDDFMVQRNFSAVAERIIALSQDAIDWVETIDVSLREQAEAIRASGDASACINSSANPDVVSVESACRLFGLTKRLTDSLRTEFVVAVDVDLPDRAQADND